MYGAGFETEADAGICFDWTASCLACSRACDFVFGVVSVRVSARGGSFAEAREPRPRRDSQFFRSLSVCSYKRGTNEGIDVDCERCVEVILVSAGFCEGIGIIFGVETMICLGAAGAGTGFGAWAMIGFDAWAMTGIGFCACTMTGGTAGAAGFGAGGAAGAMIFGAGSSGAGVKRGFAAGAGIDFGSGVLIAGMMTCFGAGAAKTGAGFGACTGTGLGAGVTICFCTGAKMGLGAGAAIGFCAGAGICFWAAGGFDG